MTTPKNCGWCNTVHSTKKKCPASAQVDRTAVLEAAFKLLRSRMQALSEPTYSHQTVRYLAREALNETQLAETLWRNG